MSLTYEDLVAARETLERRHVEERERVARESKAFLETIPEGRRGETPVVLALTLIQTGDVLSPRRARWLADELEKIREEA